jgi:hypothetical protein
MRYLAPLLMGLILLFSGCSTVRVSSDYDTKFDITTLKTFHIVHNEAKLQDTLTINRIDSALSNELTLKGYKKSPKQSAEFLIYYHIDVTNKTEMITDYQMVGMYPYRYRGMMVPTTRTYNYDEGQLIVDMINPKDNNIIYRLSVKDELKDFDTPQERTKYINEVIQALLKEFPKRS